MRTLHIEPFSGASGDMLLGALLDAGADADQVAKVLAGLGLAGWDLHIQEVTRGGLRAVAARVEVTDDEPTRRWADIKQLLQRASLEESILARATATFDRLAVVEARLHAVTVDEVTFHELGGLDTIIDVVAVQAAFHLLGIERVTATPVALGSGSVMSEHGLLPVPAPAVLELLRGVPVIAGPDAGELCTPTGAALLRELVDEWGKPGPMTVRATGYGAGSRELGHPNVLRATLGDSADETGAEQTLVLLEATVDDMSGELVPAVLDALRAAGARDAWARQVLMKKGRPGLELVALAGATEAPKVRTELFRQSTTLGVREQAVQRRALDRVLETVEVSGHAVGVKVGRLDGAVVNVAPEFEDCAKVASRTGLPVKTVLELARAAWHAGNAGP